MTELSLKNASKLTTLASLSYAKQLICLRLIDLPIVNELKANLPNVTEIILKDLPILTSIEITAPKLQRLSVTNCPQLKLLNLPNSPMLDNLFFVECAQLPLADFYNDWPEFIHRCNPVPHQLHQKLAQKLINKITQSFGNSLFEDKDYFYDSVCSYIDDLKLSWRWDIDHIWSQKDDNNNFLEFACITENFIFHDDKRRDCFLHDLQNEDLAVRGDVFCAFALRVLAGNRDYRAYINLFLKEFSTFDASRMKRIEHFIKSMGHGTTPISELTPEDRQASYCQIWCMAKI